MDSQLLQTICDGLLDKMSVMVKKVSELEAQWGAEKTQRTTLELELKSLHAQMQERVAVTENELSGNIISVINMTTASAEINQRVNGVYDDLAAVQKRIEAKTDSIAPYIDGDVVRRGTFKRFGVGGIFEALNDTAKGLESKSDWLMISDGLYCEPNDAGLVIKSFSGLYTYQIRRGAEGQRGKTGSQGLRGNDGKDGLGITELYAGEDGMAITFTDGLTKSASFLPAQEKFLKELMPFLKGGGHD